MSKPGKEDVLLHQLRSQGYDIFFPRLTPAAKRAKRIIPKACFPGYLFIRLDLQKDSLSTFQWMPNTEGLVCFGPKPAFVPDHLLEAIRRHTEEREVDESDQKDPVERDMPMAISGYQGFTAIFNPNLSSDERVRELLRMLRGEDLAPAAND